MTPVMSGNSCLLPRTNNGWENSRISSWLITHSNPYSRNNLLKFRKFGICRNPGYRSITCFSKASSSITEIDPFRFHFTKCPSLHTSYNFAGKWSFGLKIRRILFFELSSMFVMNGEGMFTSNVTFDHVPFVYINRIFFVFCVLKKFR